MVLTLTIDKMLHKPLSLLLSVVDYFHKKQQHYLFV